MCSTRACCSLKTCGIVTAEVGDLTLDAVIIRGNCENGKQEEWTVQMWYDDTSVYHINCHTPPDKSYVRGAYIVETVTPTST